MVLTGCSGHSPKASTRPLIDSVQAGKDMEFPGGYVLHVTKREGSSVEGIRIHFPHPSGPASEITAETGTIQPGLADHSDYENQLMYNKTQITITLFKAKNVTGPTNATFARQVIVLYKPT
jgi:hypothetical protein